MVRCKQHGPNEMLTLLQNCEIWSKPRVFIAWDEKGTKGRNVNCVGEAFTWSSNPKAIQLGPCQGWICLETSSLNGCRRMSTEEESPSFVEMGWVGWVVVGG